MELKNSLDWQLLELQLTKNASLLKNRCYQLDANGLIAAIGMMVSKLSKLEVEQRRSPLQTNKYTTAQVEQINAAISSLGQWITMLLLKGK